MEEYRFIKMNLNRFLILDEIASIDNRGQESEYCCREMMETMESRNFDLKYRPRDAQTYLISRESGEDGGPAWWFNYCPFCGKSLKSKYDLFLSTIKEELGIDTESEDCGISEVCKSLPEEFKTDEWWKKRGL
jgi:DNA-directed RNA polymerase subunit N (RpoN/RPB10)